MVFRYDLMSLEVGVRGTVVSVSMLVGYIPYRKVQYRW